MSDEMLDSIRGWLETSGRAFELRTAKQFAMQGARTRTSYVYTDPSTSKQREGDVLASFYWQGPLAMTCEIQVVVECKSGRKHPWAAFVGRDRSKVKSRNDWIFYAHSSPESVAEAIFRERWLGMPPLDEPRIASHVAAVHVNESVNPANDALRQVMSAAESKRSQYIGRGRSERTALAILPVVAIEAPLVTCRLSDGGEIHLEEVDHVRVWAHTADGKPAPALIATEAYLLTLASGVRDLAASAEEYFQTL